MAIGILWKDFIHVLLDFLIVQVFWPTVPTMTFGEELHIHEAPIAKSANVQFLNFSARAWSHSTKDHFHDEWGYLTVDGTGNATLMTAGNNGERFSMCSEKPRHPSVFPTMLRRTFIKHDDRYMEQILEMRTATHPKSGYLEHTRDIVEQVGVTTVYEILV
ncbi:unnamed protein product [Nippostrongylus brasiliensis]|uniref:DUF1794 domain-containing protein n=1 Tax=Nippostrongylus brasiliensis TaxID=27835 RepID=A0A0N4YF45_NIPBR|nr:unnamed protein product [Nippostrongylus brasiliensis]